MALKCNGRLVFFNNPGSYLGPTSWQSGNFIKGGLRNRNVGAFSNRFSGYPNGAIHPESFILPQKTGSLASYTRSASALDDTTANLIPAMPMIASSSMSLAVTNAQLDQIFQIIASGTLALTGSASIASAVSALASGSIVLSGSAQLGGIIPIYANSSMALTANVVLTALAFMEAEAGGPTPLSPEGLANAVLDALLADHNTTGTVGEALNNVRASGNPWSSDLASNNTDGTFGKKVQELLTKIEYLGLK